MSRLRPAAPSPSSRAPGLPDVIPLAARPVFSVDATTYTWGDVVLAARGTGSWAEIERRAFEGLACEARAGARGESVPADDLRAAAGAFRYAHDLLSGDELEAWLERWSLGLDDWLGYLRRRLLRERGPEKASAPAGEAPEAAAAVWAEAVCSGALAGFARDLAARAAVWERDAAGSAPLPEPGRLEEVVGRFRARAATAEAVSKEIERHRLDWLQLEVLTAAFADEDAAREAALCVDEDGLSLKEAARLAGTDVRLVAGMLDELDPALTAVLVGARPGELVGPVRLGAEVTLAALRSRRPPTAADPDVRARAERAVASRAVEREERDRVRWLEHI